MKSEMFQKKPRGTETNDDQDKENVAKVLGVNSTDSQEGNNQSH